jgi:hypothetical protein
VRPEEAVLFHAGGRAGRQAGGLAGGRAGGLKVPFRNAAKAPKSTSAYPVRVHSSWEFNNWQKMRLCKIPFTTASPYRQPYEPGQWTFMKFYTWGVFRKYPEKIQVSLKSDESDGTCTCVISCQFFFSQNDEFYWVVEKIKNTHFVFNIFFFPKIFPFCEVMCKNMVEPDTKQMTIYARHAW